jgi:hypothetical protein
LVIATTKGFKMTYIKMKQTRKVSECGYIVRQLEEGVVYDLRESAARECFREGWGAKPTEAEIVEYEVKKNNVAAAISSFGDDYVNMINSVRV